jgi:short-subunit dehydrogenase
MKLAQASVVLTGAAGGIGAPTARALVAAGARVLLVGRDGGRLASLASDLLPADDRTRVDWLAADLTTPAGIEAVRAAALARRANVLVNNAGIASFGRLGALGEAHIEQVIATNLLAPMLLTRALLPGLQAQTEAAVLNVGSVLGRLALPGFTAYSAAKFGLRGFTEALRRELAGGPVRVQYLGPRVTETDFNSPEVDAYNRSTGSGADRPEVVAEALLAMLRDGQAERFLGFPEKLAVRLNGLVPSAMDGAFARHRQALPAV